MYISQVSGERLQDHWSSGLFPSQVDVENATETARFYESQAGELEEKLRLKEKVIKDLEHSLQVMRYEPVR